MNSSTQLEFVKKSLLAGGWVSGKYFLENFIPRYGARIWDLKKVGWNIDSRRVEGKRYFEYRLVLSETTNKIQATLPKVPEKVGAEQGLF